ncbi:deoxyribodipyrimidine photo-lyase [Mesobacterium sp. TK19101]|uniref:Deoxyribodipyrimidine photo-lyase n=1 Tax=Mesobacterium hydrothermale TaxID=3111907 RepID=A0ABU6HFE8_9RHOB|nr:deoxyribodipyrimidine photo-lyase [Mesobacterium sp. TK19101]MEC3860198.1 deoxyribodipyrimidine photo-lyase [Mesobacterium sp. TK19101]
MGPSIVWIRRDLRLSDHPAMRAAVARGGPVVLVFFRDDLVDGLGAAPKWRLGLGLEAFARALEARGQRLILRSGAVRDGLLKLAAEVGAEAVYWIRAYDPASVARDTEVKAALKEAGLVAESFAGHLLFEPWTVETGQGGFYKVYTPYWKAVRTRSVAEPLAAPGTLPAPRTWPDSEALEDWSLGAAMRRGAAVVARHVSVGEAAAQGRLGAFVAQKVADYGTRRDFPAEEATSGLSGHLSLGEISPAMCWQAGRRAMEEGKPGAEVFLKELVWRDFAYHLMWHTPHLLTRNWREDWDGFPWNEDESRPEVVAWKRGRTGIRFVDAALREMYVTGRMHNRARMIVASYLTKHLLSHWKTGQRWFEDCLEDWDPAANAMGWQWAAGSGPDAAPYFRVFNPVTQLEKFDPRGTYVRRWIAEGVQRPTDTALSYFDAIPESWGLSPDMPYPAPVVEAADGRTAALDAYARFKQG